MKTTRALKLFLGDVLVGTLLDETPLKFEYDYSWLNQAHATPISPNISLSPQTHAGEAVEAYFENLLPEAGLRDLLKIKHQTTTTFGLLSVIGGDTASAYSLLPEGEQPQAPQYLLTSWYEIAESLQNPNSSLTNLVQADGARISLAGAQNKKTIFILPNGLPALPLGNSPSSHILKPNIGGLQSVWSSALNETFIMQLAQAIGMNVAETSYQPIVKACLIKRYDRAPNQSGKLARIHQLDLCQLDSKPSHIKYESDGGPSLAKCRQLLAQNNVPAIDFKRLIEWVFFNLFVGNNDSHAKNLSIYFPDNQLTTSQNPQLTPFYDMLSTSLYAGLSAKFAFKIGGENIPGNITTEHLQAMAKALNFKPSYVLGIASSVAQRLLQQTENTTQHLARIASAGTEQTLLERLNQHVIGNTSKLQTRWGI